MENTYLLEVQNAQSFIEGRLELYKIKFAETGNNKFLETMNNFNKTLNTIKKMDLAIQRLTKKNSNDS